MKKYKYGIIGCGGITNGKHMPAIAKLKEVEMVAFCDIIPERAEKANKDFGGGKGKVYTDYREMLKSDLDAVVVGTPNCSHCEITVAALNAGKNVLCEKPMAMNYDEARQMLAARDKSGKVLTIGYQNRYRPECLYLKQECEAGTFGDIYYAHAQAIRRRAVPTWGVFIDEEKQGGGPLIDIGTHALDLTLWEMDNYEPAMVVGQTFRKLADTENAANAWGSWDPKKFTVEDSAFGFVRMKNGAIISLEASWALNTLLVDEAKTILCGDKAGADMIGEGDALRINGEKFSRLYTTVPDLAMNSGAAFFEGVGAGKPHEIEARMWIDHVKDDTKPLIVKPEQAYVVTQILEAIYQSSKTGQPVFF